MLVPGDLGFPGLVLVFVVLFLCGPVVSFLIQWRWKVLEERKEEIMRLVEMASEEAQRAELESANVVECVGAFGGVRGFQCAMCYCPTTTRCSRCKVVRYCSGKCQIIHWRKGHKEECHPPSTTIWLNAREGDFDQEVSLQGQQKFHVTDLENEGGDRYPEPIEIFSEASLPSEFSNPSLSAGKEVDNSVLTNEPLLDGHVIPRTLKKSKRSLLNTGAPYAVETSNDVYDTSSPPSEFTGSVSSVDTISFSSNLKPKTSRRRPRANDCGPGSSSGSSIIDLEECTVSESMYSSSFRDASPDTIVLKNGVCDDSKTINCADDILSDSGSHLHIPFNGSQRASTSSLPPLNPQIHEYDDAYPTNFKNEMTSSGVVPSNHVVPSAPAAKNLPVRRSGHPAATDNHHSNASQPSKSKGRRSLSSIASEGHQCSSTRRHSVSSAKLFNSSEIASSLSNPSNSLKTTVQKVAQQLRVPNLSKHHSNGIVGCEATGKKNHKMLFPYELFMTLCNWEKMELHPCGLTNCGNTCYANAVLQCLAFTQPLTAYLLQGMHSKACTRKEWCFTCEFEGLILNASKGVSPLSPIGIVSKIQSMGSNLCHGKEEDAHEFLRCAIDSMQLVCLKEAGVNALNPLAEETTLIGLIFGGYLRSKIKCMKCHGKSEQHERMMDLTVEIQGDIATLEEALGRFTATEILDGENKYQCSRCKSYERAKKKLTVLEAPNVLTIAFKRFQSGKFGKLNKSVRFPETLNLAPYMSVKSEKSPLYKLYAVVVHLDVMNAAFSGHYVCYVKNIQGKWFKADDSRVKPVELDRVLSKEAYMLLYSRCSPQAPGLVRNVNMLSGIKSMREKSSKAISNSYNRKGTTSSAKPGSNAVPSYDHSTEQQRAESYSHWKPLDGLSTFESLDSYRRYYPVGRIPRVNSLSDNSSLFSCSDEASCSTESTRDSVSTDDFSEYVFGDPRFSWNSPMRIPDESNGHALHSKESRRYSPPYKIEQVVEENPQFLYSDKANYGIKLRHPTSRIDSSSSSSEANSNQLGWGNPFDMKSGVSLRRSTLERAAQTFY